MPANFPSAGDETSGGFYSDESAQESSKNSHHRISLFCLPGPLGTGKQMLAIQRATDPPLGTSTFPRTSATNLDLHEGEKDWRKGLTASRGAGATAWQYIATSS